MEKRLSETIEIEVRFSEVDSMKVVWHGNYMQYFEDGREAFGRKYGLDYLTIYGQGYFVPVVDIAFHYRKPMEYGRKALLTVTYRPCEAAKILFDYEIKDSETGEVLTTGSSVQVFMDRNYQLEVSSPAFYKEWKKRWL